VANLLAAKNAAAE